MPNWCSTTFKFHGSQNDLDIFEEKITEWTSKSFAKSDFGSDWLGNVLYGAGLQDRIDNPDPEKRLACRGNIIGWSCGCVDGIMDIWVESAWVPMAKMWVEVIKVLGLNIDFTFSAEEPGCDLFWIYDPKGYKDWDDTEVYIDADFDGKYFCEYTDEEGAIETLNRLLKTNINNLDVLIDKCRSCDDSEYPSTYADSYIYASRFEKVTELYD